MTTSKIEPSVLDPKWEQTGDNSWTVTLVEDGNDIVMPIPDELLAAQGWAIGDTLVWDHRDDGTIFLTKQ